MIEKKIEQEILLQDEMSSSYLDYAISVIVHRSIPDVRDGLKPVQRRILYGMYINGNQYYDRTRKSVQISGFTMMNFHPHGDSSIYEAAVRLTQKFAMSSPLIIGQGNFGSIDGDSAAAARYTEMKMSKLAHHLLDDLPAHIIKFHNYQREKMIVEFNPSYDHSVMEPAVLPVKYPNLLVNGASGIAVGMATNIPPHNLKETIECCRYLLENPEASIEDLIKIIKGPDLPTKCQVFDSESLKEIYRTGRGSFIMRANAHIEERKIIFTSIPYQVTKSSIVVAIDSLIKEEKLVGVSHVTDESNIDNGIRVVVSLKKESIPELLLKQLYSSTNLQMSFGAIILTINQGAPKILNLKEIMANFISFRHSTLIAKYSVLLNESREKMHNLMGLVVAKENIEEIIKIIRNAEKNSESVEIIMEKKWNAPSLVEFQQEEFDRGIDYHNYEISLSQAEAITSMRIKSLSKQEIKGLIEDIIKIRENIIFYSSVISQEEERKKIILQELAEVEKLSPDRRSTILYDYSVIEDKDLIPNDCFIVVLDHNNNIKKMPMEAYRTQRRGGLGKSAMDNLASSMVISYALDEILFFSSKEKVYSLDCYKIPTMSAGAIGRAMINFLALEKDEKITNMCAIEKERQSLIFITAKGIIKKNSIRAFSKIRQTGKKAIRLQENDRLVTELSAGENESIMLFSKKGKVARFAVKNIREIQSCDSIGVKGIKLTKDDEVVACCLAKDVDCIISISKLGLCKISSVEKYTETNRGAKGVSAMKLSGKDEVVSAFSVPNLEGEIITMTKSGQLVRSNLSEIRTTGRNTKGVKLVHLKEDDQILYSMKGMEEIKEALEV